MVTQISPSAQALREAVAQVKNPPRLPQTDERTEQARQALADLKQANRNLRHNAKAEAKERLARIKQQIQLLRQFGGDPKALARQLAHLARELGAAAKAYAAAGGETEPQAVEPLPDGQPPQDQTAGEEKPGGDLRDEVLREFRETEERGKQAKADHEFVAEARRLLRQLKTMIEEAKRRSDKGDPDIRDAMRAAEAAAAEVDEVLPAVQGGVDVSV